MKQRTFPWRWILFAMAFILTAVWLFLTPDRLFGKASAIGYAVCHQIPERTFYVNGRPLPLCARCSGMFLGAVLGVVYQAGQGRKGKMPPLAVLILLGVLALAWALDGVNSFAMLVPAIPSLYATQNWTRLITGTGMGLGLSAILLPSFIQTVFKDWEDVSSLGNWKQVLGLLLIAAVMDVLTLLEIPWVLLPLGFISAAGVLVLLTIVYSMVLVMIFRKENTYTRLGQMVNALVGGYMVALIQIGAIDLLRYTWTGTWSGFTF